MAHNIPFVLFVFTNKCYFSNLSCNSQIVKQINPAGLQSPMCMFYDYVTVGKEYILQWLDNGYYHLVILWLILIHVIKRGLGLLRRQSWSSVKSINSDEYEPMPDMTYVSTPSGPFY